MTKEKARRIDYLHNRIINIEFTLAPGKANFLRDRFSNEEVTLILDTLKSRLEELKKEFEKL